MRKMFSIKYSFLSLVVLLACSQVVFANPVNTIVRGKVHNAGTQSVALYKVENGEAVKIGFRWPAKDGSFSFDIPLENEAIFFLSTKHHSWAILKMFYISNQVRSFS